MLEFDDICKNGCGYDPDCRKSSRYDHIPKCCHGCKYENWPRVYYPCRNCSYAYDVKYIFWGCKDDAPMEKPLWSSDKYICQCSVCGYIAEEKTPYCPNCGTYMGERSET